MTGERPFAASRGRGGVFFGSGWLLPPGDGTAFFASLGVLSYTRDLSRIVYSFWRGKGRKVDGRQWGNGKTGSRSKFFLRHRMDEKKRTEANFFRSLRAM